MRSIGVDGSFSDVMEDIFKVDKEGSIIFMHFH